MCYQMGERQLDHARVDTERTFLRVLGRSKAFSHMEQEWILLRCRPGGLGGRERISFCGGDGGLIGGIAIAGEAVCSSRVAMEEDEYMSLICGGPDIWGTWEMATVSLVGDANGGGH